MSEDTKVHDIGTGGDHGPKGDKGTVVFSRDILLQKEELEMQFVRLDEDGNGVFVKAMCASERDDFERDMMEEQEDENGTVFKVGMKNFRAKLAVRTVVDENGTLIFSPDDVERLGKSMSAKRMELIVTAAQKLNNISKKDREKLEGKSEGNQESDSSSDSA